MPANQLIAGMARSYKETLPIFGSGSQYPYTRTWLKQYGKQRIIRAIT